jgi:hypothetical protein
MSLFLINPLASLFGAIILALTLYTSYVKVENVVLKKKVESFQAQDKIREAEVAAALKRNAEIERNAKQRNNDIEQEAARVRKIANDHRTRIDQLTRRLRSHINSCAVPITIASADGSTKAIASGELPNEGGTVLARLAEEYANLAASAEETRITALACQRFNKPH